MGSLTNPIVLMDAFLTTSMILFFTAVGFRFRVGRGRAAEAGDVWLTTPQGRLCGSICLMGFCALMGLFFIAILARFTELPVPAFLGGLVVAILVRSTTELTNEEFPEREVRAIGWISLCAILVLLLAKHLVP